MSDYTKSDYTKTGKKAKSINSNRVDLTYNKIYEVFVDIAKNEFIIDDVGDWRYGSMDDSDWYELVGVRCYQSSAIFEEVDDTVDTDNTIVETNNKFKEGDKVVVVNTDYISAYDAGVRVGDIGTVIESGVDKYLVEFEGTGYDCDWFFTDNCIELVCDKHDNGNNYILDDDDDEQPKQQFSVGDKVKVKSISTLPRYKNHGVNVGDIAEIIGVFKIGNGGVADLKCDKWKNDWNFPFHNIELVIDSSSTNQYNPLAVQQSGNHYKNGEIQPIEYSERNNLSMCQGNIVKYISRHKEKNGVDDLAKVVHYALLEALFVYGEDGATELRDKIDSLINIKNGF